MGKGSGPRPGPWTAVLGIAGLYIGSTLQTPLYPIYRREFGFSELVVTEIYAVYAIGNLAVLFFFGRLSDQLGRRRTTLAALALTLLSALCFLCARGTPWLFSARVINGFAAGLGAGALTAWIAELEPRRDKKRAAVLASAGNLAGLAFGAIMAGALADVAPLPIRLSYIVYLGLLGLVLLAIRSVPDTIEHPVRRLAELSLRPRIGVPAGLRWKFVAPASLAFASFALGGFYSALVPGLLMRMGHSHAVVVGAVAAAFFGTGAMVIAASHRMQGRATLRASVGLLLTGLALLMIAEAQRSLAILVVATVVAGAATALGYRGSLQIVNEMAPDDRRAELVSSYLLVCYTANSLPVVGVGLLSQVVSAQAAHRIFAVVLAVLALVALVFGRAGHRGERGERPAMGRRAEAR